MEEELGKPACEWGRHVLSRFFLSMFWFERAKKKKVPGEREKRIFHVLRLKETKVGCERLFRIRRHRHKF